MVGGGARAIGAGRVQREDGGGGDADGAGQSTVGEAEEVTVVMDRGGCRSGRASPHLLRSPHRFRSFGGPWSWELQGTAGKSRARACLFTKNK